MSEKVTKRLHVLDGGGGTGEYERGRRVEATQELNLELDSDSPFGDYESFCAELDAVLDPSPKDWWEWADRYFGCDRSGQD